MNLRFHRYRERIKARAELELIIPVRRPISKDVRDHLRSVPESVRLRNDHCLWNDRRSTVWAHRSHVCATNHPVGWRTAVLGFIPLYVQGVDEE